MSAAVINPLIYVHVMSLAMWFGGLFVYLLVVWPALHRVAKPSFPRAPLAMIGVRSAPWIFLAMAAAFVSLVGYWVYGGEAHTSAPLIAYSVVLMALIGNNLYGAAVTWPRVMLLPLEGAQRAWTAFHRRMAVSLLMGLSLLSVCILFFEYVTVSSL